MTFFYDWWTRKIGTFDDLKGPVWVGQHSQVDLRPDAQAFLEALQQEVRDVHKANGATIFVFCPTTKELTLRDWSTPYTVRHRYG